MFQSRNVCVLVLYNNILVQVSRCFTRQEVNKLTRLTGGDFSRTENEIKRIHHYPDSIRWVLDERPGETLFLVRDHTLSTVSNTQHLRRYLVLFLLTGDLRNLTLGSGVIKGQNITRRRDTQHSHCLTLPFHKGLRWSTNSRYRHSSHNYTSWEFTYGLRRPVGK